MGVKGTGNGALMRQRMRVDTNGAHEDLRDGGQD